MNKIESAVLANTIQYINNYLKNNEKMPVIEPLTCMIRLAILSFKKKGTKICFQENSIYIQEPSFLQGTIRWLSGDNRNDLHYLLNPIIKSIHKWDPNKNESIKNIYKLAISGLENLKNGYHSNNRNISSLISHSIDLYINLINDSINGINNKNISTPDMKYIVDNEVYQTSLYTLWNNEQIQLINSLFIEANKTKEDFTYYLNAIENILTIKIKNAKDIVVKNRQILFN